MASLGASTASATASNPSGGGSSGMDWMQYLMPMLGGSMLGQGLFGLFGRGDNPYQAGDPYYKKMMEQLPGYYEPWTTAGKGALPMLQQQYGQLIGNPGDVYSKLAAGYKESPGYQFRQKTGQEAAMNMAAAGGMAGTPMAQEQAASISENIANQDFMNYLQSVMGLYGAGLGGMGDISKQGLLGSIGLGENMSSILSQQAQDAIKGQQSQQQSSQMDWGNIVAGLAPIIMKVMMG